MGALHVKKYSQKTGKKANETSNTRGMERGREKKNRQTDKQTYRTTTRLTKEQTKKTKSLQIVSQLLLTLRGELLGMGVKVLTPVCCRKFPENGLARPPNVYTHKAECKELSLNKKMAC